MNTNDLDTSVNRSDGRLIPKERQRAAAANWSSWIDPSDARDSLRIDTPEALRSELRVTEARPPSAGEQPKTSDEELETVNARLRAKIADLSRENDTINSMLEGTGIATVFLDRNLRVVRFTPAAKEIGYDRMVEMVEDARSVLDTLRAKQVDTQASGGRWYRMDVCPHRAVDDTIVGVAITFVDVTEHHHAAQESARRLAEKETLLKEVHHRVRNNTASIVGILSIQAQSIPRSEARSVLQGAIGRVKSMSVLYDKLLVSEQYGASSVKDYLEGVADSVMALSSQRTNTVLEKRIADFTMESDDLFTLGLITNELLTNVIKHAFHGRAHGLITLTLERVADCATLVVQDDGAGLPPGFDPTAADGFGLPLIRMLSEQIHGSFSISAKSGTRSVLEFAL